ncbi:triose-phosphate isomerase [Sphingobium subterraneum]|uniref:Triosephosphate isomerase n=1 Tax=Sphingobium subterraneum TaxID=627688 RepID=A0A841J1V2_9SPHN|nr:triose-phosphate isomerase [Sphingobium subterraneum]MBB6122625.1 triosephosphate isomerase [Sphingobium subterraneum]
MTRKMLVAGNWKMNGLRAHLADIAAIGDAAKAHPGVEVGLYVPATLITAAAERADGIFVGAQDCHAKSTGAHTGCLGAAMLGEAGATSVIVGHSERRTDQHESDADIAAKALAARAEDLSVVLCVGESLETRDSGSAVSFVLDQLLASLPEGAAADWLSIAYEPIWAIGTGRIPTMEQIAEMHGAIRGALAARLGAETAAAMRILYGGSVNAGNAADIFTLEDVDGGLVGGASLKAETFGPIITAADAAS